MPINYANTNMLTGVEFNNWQSTYTTVQANSSTWDAGGGGGGTVDTGVRALTANWQSTYSTVQTNSSTWGTGGVPQTLSFNENNAELTLSLGNTISLSALSGGGGGGGGGETAIGITIDGAGYAITTGDKGSITVPYNATLNNVTMIADVSGVCIIDIFKSNFSTYPTSSSICSTSLPAISGAIKSVDASLAGWDTNIQSGDILSFQVLSASNITKLNLTIGATKY